MNELKARIEELKSDLRYRDDQIKELREENHRVRELNDEMGEGIESGNELIQSWIEVFELEQNEDGVYVFNPGLLLDQHSKLFEEHEKLLREWNKFVGQYNATIDPQGIGRPLQASDTQVTEVRGLRKAGASLRGIAEETGLGIRTVRTIVGKDAGTDRASKRTNRLRKREIDRLRAAHHRAQKRTRDQLPKRIDQTLKRGQELIKASKGL